MNARWGQFSDIRVGGPGRWSQPVPFTGLATLDCGRRGASPCGVIARPSAESVLEWSDG